MKTSELTGAALDWAVAKCKGELEYWPEIEYSTDWAQGGPIIEQERLHILQRAGETVWCATFSELKPKPDGTGLCFLFEQGPTPLIAAMRTYVASKLGDDDIDVPEELS
jgi:hypothetical protein